MQLNKQLTATLSPSAIGANYTWSAENCTCQTSCINCSCVFFSNISGVVDVTLEVTSTISYPDDCTDIIIKLTTTNEVDGEVCEDFTYYEITKDSQGTQLTWACTTAEEGCKQIASLTPIFETEEDCTTCATCPCSTTSPCASAQFIASYDCDTKILLIDTTNAGDWCDGITVLNYIDINQTLYNSATGQQVGFNLHHVPSPADPLCGPTVCAPAFPVEIDCTDNPFPNGTYSVNVTVSLSDCITTITDLWIVCGTTVANAGCCLQASADDIQYHQQGEPPRVYSIYLDDPSTTTMTIEFQTFVVADKLSVFTTWDPNTLTGNEIATTGYIGACANECNDYFALEFPPVDFYQGYIEKEYDIPTTTVNYSTPCGAGGYNTIEAPNTFTIPAVNSYGSAKLVLKPDYLDAQPIIDNIVYIVVYSNQNTDHTACFTVWQFHLMCGTYGAPGYQCPCVNPAAPLFYISEELCGGVNNTVIQPGYIEWTSNCPLSSNPQWSIDGGTTWTDTPITYEDLEPGSGSVCIRCAHNTAEECYSDSTCVNYNKPTCCNPSITSLVQCNTSLYPPSNTYTYEVTFVVQDCTDYVLTPNGASNTNIFVTDTVVGDELIIKFYCELLDTSPPVTPGMSYFRYSLTCNDCGSPNTSILSFTPALLNVMNNDLNCTPHPTRCCSTLFVVTAEEATLNGSIDLTIGAAPYTYTFSYDGTGTTGLQNSLNYINTLYLAAHGIVLSLNNADYNTYYPPNYDCENLTSGAVYTIMQLEYNCEDEIVFEISFTTDYSSELNTVAQELVLDEDGTTCTFAPPECGFCILAPILRNTIITDTETITIEFDGAPGCEFVGVPIGQVPFSLTLVDSNNVNVPQNVIQFEEDTDCNVLTPNIAITPNFGLVYTNLAPNISYYLNPANGTLGVYTVHMEDGRGCTLDFPICIVDYEILTCIPVTFICQDTEVDGAQYFTGVTINGVFYPSDNIPVAAENDYLGVTKPAILNFLNSIPNIPGGFSVNVGAIEPHLVTIIYFGCTGATDFSTHFTHALAPNAAYQVDDNTPTTTVDTTMAYLSDGPFTITNYSWWADSWADANPIDPTDEAYTLFTTSDLTVNADELTCTITLDCGSLNVSVNL